MKKYYRIAVLVMLCFPLGGCSTLMEPFRVIWGSSTRALERERLHAKQKVFQCSFNECYDTVLDLTRAVEVKIPVDPVTGEVLPRKSRDSSKDKDDSSEEEAALKETKPPKDIFEQYLPKANYKIEKRGRVFDLFAQDRRKGFVIVMGVSGSVNTTEAGIFLTSFGENVRVEISSLSSNAKRIVAEVVFKELARFYQEKE